MLLHKDRYYPTKTLIKGGVVIHDAESGDGASTSLLNLLKSPGNFPSSHGGVYGAGYHAITDGEGGYIIVADASAGPYSAPPLNPTWWHICMPGYANQTREQWLDKISMAHIVGVAKYVVAMWKEDGKTWPLAFIFAPNLKLGMHGYTSHYQVGLAWKETNHTDPGPNFPWDILEQEIGKLIQSPPAEEDDEMSNVRFVRNKGFINVFMIGAGPALSVSGEIMDSYPKDTPRIFQDNPQSLSGLCFQSGLDEKDPQQLVPGGPPDHF